MISFATAVTTAAVILTATFALHVLELMHDVLKDKHKGAVSDKVAPAAVSVLAQEVVEPATSVLLIEVCLACLDLGIINLICHENRYVRIGKKSIARGFPRALKITSWLP